MLRSNGNRVINKQIVNGVLNFDLVLKVELGKEMLIFDIVIF